MTLSAVRVAYQAGVTIRIHGGNQTCRLSGIIRCGPEGVCSERCRQLVMGSVSRPEDGGPSRPGIADILCDTLPPGSRAVRCRVDGHSPPLYVLFPRESQGSSIGRTKDRVRVISILEITAADGKTYRTQYYKYYNLDVIIAVGYRVNSRQATHFRIWATRTLREFIVKGFVLDDERLKQGQRFGRDDFDELLES